MIEHLRRHPKEGVALIDSASGARVTYGALVDRMDAAAVRLRSEGRPLVFLAMAPDPAAVILYLGCLAAGTPVCLVEPRTEPLDRLIAAYRPGVLLLPASLEPPPGYREGPAPDPRHRMWRRAPVDAAELHPDLALLLTTSGSTGSPKLVRLGMRAVESNALAIARYLGLGPLERAAQSLPLHYSYGLSVLHSHLVAGGSVTLTPHSFMGREFWAAVDAAACTSFAGVPYVYETLHRLRWEPTRHPTLRTLTQAGGGLRRELIAHFHERAEAAGVRFFVMYGQTEATARISYVPPEALGRKIGSIGVAIPGGRLSAAPIGDDDPRTELVYEGPNVMMGYAESLADLTLGDLQGGVLRTGDLGHADADGFFWVEGRLKRFAKLFGSRISLEDVEREVETRFSIHAAALDGGDRIVLVCAPAAGLDRESVATHVAKRLHVPPAVIAVQAVAVLPRTASGKKDYRALEAVG